ncbi:MAG: RNA polymerase sigma factor [Niabella sp.]
MPIKKSDRELLASNDEMDFRLLYDRHWKSLYRKAIARLGNEDDVKDIIQDIFVTLWRNRKSIVVENTLKPYLFTALKYSIIKKIEREYGKHHYPLNLEQIERISLTSEELLHYKQLESLINTEVDKLPNRMKEVYELSRKEHLKNKEIAEHLKISEQTVKNILSEALKRLRTNLEKYNFAIFLL